jgi:hypothetical protein
MRKTLLAAALLIFATTAAFARSSEDRASVGEDITVNEGETANDIACLFCSVRIHGDVKGDVAVLFGNVTLDPAHTISGDVAVLGGNLNMGEESSIGGDVAVAAGQDNLASSAVIHGGRSIFPGKFWLLVPLIPFIILIGIIWLIVYLVRRNRYQFPVYPNGRGI